MDWFFVVTLATAIAHPAPTPENPVVQVQQQRHEIAMRVDHDKCLSLMEQWKGRAYIGSQPILQKKCIKAPSERPTIQGRPGLSS